MGSFLDRFLPDPDFEDSRWFFEAPKPFLKDACVHFAPYDPSFHKATLGKRKPYSLDPSCPTAKTASDTVQVFIFERTESAEELQRNGWEYLVGNSEVVGAKLVKKLASTHKKIVREFVEEEMPGSRALQSHWKAICESIEKPEEDVEKFFKLVGISLATSGLDECCFVGFEFQSAWDQDHGLEIVMHKDRVLASAGMTELMSPYGSIIDGIKVIQEYEEDIDLLDTI